MPRHYARELSTTAVPAPRLCGWVNRQQLDVIDYLKEENRVLREILGEQRLRFTDAQRRRLAEKAKRLGRKVLNDIASIVAPDTLMAWHRKLIAMKWDHTDKRGPGRPRIMSNIAALIVRMASETVLGAIPGSKVRSPTSVTGSPAARSRTS